MTVAKVYYSFCKLLVSAYVGVLYVETGQLYACNVNHTADCD